MRSLLLENRPATASSQAFALAAGDRREGCRAWISCPGLYRIRPRIAASKPDGDGYAVTPEVKTVEQPVQLLNGQDNCLVGGIGRCFESLRFKAFEPKAEAVALLVQDFHSVARLVEENEKYRVEHGNLDIQFDQRSQSVDGFSKVHRFGVEVHFFDFGVGSHHGRWAPERIGSPASGISLVL